jgi:hypothetical protein
VTPAGERERIEVRVKSVQEETISLLKRDCQARATHPGGVDCIMTKPPAFMQLTIYGYR